MSESSHPQIDTCVRSAGTVSSVSVVIPVFNDQTGLEHCLNGIEAQTYKRTAIEVIVVDNGSTPAITLESDYSFSTRLIQCTTPGSYAARNVGVKAATGQLLAFIDADCWPDENWLAQGVGSLMAADGRCIVGGEVSLVKPDRPNAVALYQCAAGFGQEGNVRNKQFSATANLFCTMRQFAAVGAFDERLLSGGDREWCWRAARRGYTARYEPGAVVYTQPRSSLRGAIRQTRRVVAGRALLQSLGLTHVGNTAVAKTRSPWQAVKWILTNRKLRLWDRLRVLWVATLIRAASVVESCRLAFGANAERR